MKNRKGIMIGITLLFFFAGSIAILKYNNKSDYQEETSNGAKYQIITDGNEVEFIGFDERKPKYNSTHHQLEQIQSNSRSSIPAADFDQSKISANANLDVLIHDKFAPMTDWGRDVRFNHETNEVSIVFSSSGDEGKRIIGSIWLIGEMEKKKEKYYFKPLKWRKEHKDDIKFHEYLLENIDYIDSKGNVKTGNLKALWDWRLNDKRPFFFEEE